MPPATHAPARNTSALVEPARAKVNLYLHVLGRRADGYHELDSLVVFAELGDTLQAQPAENLRLGINGPFAAALGGESDNLVLRAAHALADEVGVPPAAALTLTKRLPVASGIGGGSADAAATLRALTRLWRVSPEPTRLHALARRLGADVPACLQSQAITLGGIGERLTPAPRMPAAGLVLINPGIPLATPAVFKARSGPFSPAVPIKDAPRDAADLAAMLRTRRNDLTGAAVALVPAVGEILAALAASPACLLARMSGSGATCFGLYADRAAAENAVDWLTARSPGWWIAPTAISGEKSAE